MVLYFYYISMIIIGPLKKDRKQSIKNKNNRSLCFHFDFFPDVGLCGFLDVPLYSRVAYIYVRSRAKYLKFRTTTSKFNTLRKPLMQQKYYFIHEM